MGKWRNRRGQSTIEYLLVFLAVLLAIIYGVNQIFKNKLQDQMDKSGNAIATATTQLNNSHQP